MKIPLEIEFAQDPLDAVFEDDTTDGDISFSPHAAAERGVFELEPIVSGTLEFAAGVSAGVVANWIWSKIKGKATRLRINRSDVHITVVAIKEAILQLQATEDRMEE